MTINNKEKQGCGGILSALKKRLNKNRLGELLVLDGVLAPQELKAALAISKAQNRPLGRVLVQENFVASSAVHRKLIQQFTLRFVIAFTAIFISFASFGMSKKARAATIKDVPSLMQVANNSFAPVSHYPKLFGSTEKRSTSLKAFTKWVGMFKRFDATLHSANGQKVITEFKNDLQAFKNLPLNKMAIKVNTLINKQRYIVDSKNYGKSDYWATPVEFFSRGGDCEDFAIAKYTALRALGVPEERLRIAIVQDMQKNIPHAILIVYTETGPVILDNQIKTVTHANRVDHYKPIFSINRHAWWLHTKPKATVTVVASR